MSVIIIMLMVIVVVDENHTSIQNEQFGLLEPYTQVQNSGATSTAI
jgi:hypothetical protein